MKTILTLIGLGLVLMVIGLDTLRVIVFYGRTSDFLVMCLFLFFGTILTSIGVIGAGVSLGNSVK